MNPLEEKTELEEKIEQEQKREKKKFWKGVLFLSSFTLFFSFLFLSNLKDITNF